MKQSIENTVNIIKQKAKDIYWLIPFCILALWILDTIFSLFNTGFVKVELILILLIAAKLGILGYNLFILWQLFIQGKTKYYHTFKTFTGYAVIFVYVFYSLPRLSWEIQNLIQPADSVRLWVFSFISSFIVFCLYWTLRYSKTMIKWGIVTEKELNELKDKKKVKSQKKKVKKTVKEHIIENVHVVVQAIITVIIIQHFTFQLYEIPTESMVPTFLMKDRVFVTKIQYGPSIPLTNWRLPSLVKLKRGDIVVFQSPEYKQDDVIKKILHEFVFYLTLSMVNIDKDESGEVRKQLIVKRLVGVPGEKLKMIDDVVYVKKPGDKEFKILEEDKKFRHVDLFNEPHETYKRIASINVTKDRRDLLNKWDDWKRKANLLDLNSKLISLAAEIEEKLQTINPAETAKFFENIFAITQPNFKSDYEVVKNFLDRNALKPFTDIGTVRTGEKVKARIFYNGKIAYFDTLQIKNNLLNYNELGIMGIDSLQILKTDTLRSWVTLGYDQLLFWKMLTDTEMAGQFKNFLLSTTADTARQPGEDFDLYMRKLNIQLKIMLAEKYNTYLDLFISGLDVNKAMAEIAANEAASEFGELLIYLQMHFDNRNFPEFPAGENEYIPANHYFLMGDNRYNSLDFRYSHNERKNWHLAKLDKYDPYSVTYISQLEPYLLERENILGTGKVRIWPPDRWGTF